MRPSSIQTNSSACLLGNPGNLVKNAIEEGKRIPKRMETGSDLGTCIKWIEDIGVPVIYAYSAYYLDGRRCCYVYSRIETLTQVLQRGYMWVITPTTQGTMLPMSANLNHGYTMLASLHTFH